MLFFPSGASEMAHNAVASPISNPLVPSITADSKLSPINHHRNKEPGTFGRTPRYRLQMFELQWQRTFSPPKQFML